MPQLFALVVLGVAHLFDYTSFLVMYARHGLGAEANPVVVYIFDLGGLSVLALAKILAVGVAALLMLVVATRHKRLALVMLLFGIGAGMIGGMSNIATL